MAFGLTLGAPFFEVVPEVSLLRVCQDLRLECVKFMFSTVCSHFSFRASSREAISLCATSRLPVLAYSFHSDSVALDQQPTRDVLLPVASGNVFFGNASHEIPEPIVVLAEGRDPPDAIVKLSHEIRPICLLKVPPRDRVRLNYRYFEINFDEDWTVLTVREVI